MSKEIKQYTDVGHDDPKDIIWILQDGAEIWKTMRGATLTHELLWGEDIENHWRGRYEVKTGYCSITPPADKIGERKRPYQSLLNLLQENFSVTKFYYFADGVESFEPNPRKRGSLGGYPI